MIMNGVDSILVNTFKALGDESRLNILALLLNKPLYVCEIGRRLHLAFSTTSQHLTILSEAGFLNCAKEGKWVRYSIASNSFNAYIPAILTMLREWLPQDLKAYDFAIRNCQLISQNDKKFLEITSTIDEI